MSVSRLNLRAVVSSRGEATKFVSRPNDAVLVERGEPRWLVLSCPCGCGEHFPINLDPRAGPAWRIYQPARGQLSVFPSVWRDTGCRSHYIIWRGAVHLFGTAGPDEVSTEIDVKDLQQPVIDGLSSSDWRHFAEIASRLDAVPWDVLEVCRRLVKRKQAVEESGELRGHFRLIDSRGRIDRSV
jgi:hypothetical protein